MRQDLMVSLFSRVFIDGEGAEDNQILGRALNAEIATFGYTMDGHLLGTVSALPRQTLSSLRFDLLETLGTISGASKRYQTLYRNFPYETPDHFDYLSKRILAYVTNTLRIASGKVLSCGHVVDTHLFDLDAFGACPICQHQVKEIVTEDVARFDFKSVTPLKVLRLATRKTVAAEAQKMLARQGSISVDERTFLLAAKEIVPLSRPSTPIFKEILPFAATVLPVEVVVEEISGARDVLRIATFMSDPEADLSLKENTRFKLSTSEKKRIMAFLEGLKEREEDMMRDRERWLRLGTLLAVGSAKNARRFPKTAAAFHRLRNAPEGILTFNRLVEADLRPLTTVKRDRAERVLSLIETLKARPGEFVRRLDVLLRNNAGQGSAIIAALIDILPSVNLRLLLEVRKALAFRLSGTGGERVFFIKGNVNKAKIIDDKRRPINDELLQRAIEAFDAAIFKAAAGEPMGKVWIDPDLRHILVPFNRRGDSSTNVPILKGSSVPMPEADIIRLFLYWQGEVDIDLSANFYTDAFIECGCVAFTGTKLYGCTHSGDIQSAPKGAAEFIDLNVASLLKNRVRYVLASAIVFRGGVFGEIPAFAGFMTRDAVASGKKFEPQSVVHKFILENGATTSLPVVFDLVERRMVYLDLAAGRQRFSAAVIQAGRFATILKTMMTLPERKVTMFDVLFAHAAARGTVVMNEKDADRVFRADLNPVDVLAEFAP